MVDLGETMSEITSLDSKRDEKKTTLERIEAVFADGEIEGLAEGILGIAIYGYKDSEGSNFYVVATGGDAVTSSYMGLMQIAGHWLYRETLEAYEPPAT